MSCGGKRITVEIVREGRVVGTRQVCQNCLDRERGEYQVYQAVLAELEAQGYSTAWVNFYMMFLTDQEMPRA